MTVRSDFGRTAGDYARHRAGFPPSLLVRLRPFGIGIAGQRVLDLGTGTGTLARQFARERCRVVGVDPSDPMMEKARAMDAEEGVSVEYLNGRAEEIPLADASQDVVMAGQCWHWFDGRRAASEVARVLRPGGIVAIAHFDWLPLPGNVVEATEALITKHNPAWHLGGGTGLYPKWLPDLAAGGFVAIETFSFDLDVPYTHEGWRGRIRASAGVAASLDPPAVEAFDREHAEILRTRFPSDPLHVPHRIWAAVARKPAHEGEAAPG